MHCHEAWIGEYSGFYCSRIISFLASTSRRVSTSPVSFTIFANGSYSVHAPAPPPQTGSDVADPSTSGSVLGLVPHQLRGFLAQFRNMPIIGAAYDKCTGCSETVSDVPFLRQLGSTKLILIFFRF